MQEALSWIYSIYDLFLDFIFNEALIDEGISLGWILVCVIVFGILIRSFIVVPKGIAVSVERDDFNGGMRSSNRW